MAAERAGRSRAEPAGPSQALLWRAGRTGWALLGLVVVLGLLGYLLSQLVLVVVPLILALFPATLLVPVTDWLKSKGVPAALAAAGSILGGLLVVGAVIGAMVPLVINDLPELAESAAEGVEEVQQQLEDGVLGFEFEGIDQLLDAAQEQMGEAGELAGQALSTAVVAFETFAGLLLLFVFLFFYLKDGRRLAAGVIATLPGHLQSRTGEAAQRAWDTLGAYFRGQLLVALADAVAIGIGLLILGVPLALPLAVLVFFGGLFPIIGAVITGALAVLVAAADGGLVVGLIVLAIVLAVQQLESNVLEPLILGQAIALHPMVVLVAITTGTVTLGVFGAFISVPIAAIIARVMDQIAGRTEEPADGPSVEDDPATARAASATDEATTGSADGSTSDGSGRGGTAEDDASR
jgi:putative heme transporter